MPDISKLARAASYNNRTAQNGQGIQTGLKKQYFAYETQAYTEQVGEYASNVYETACQGLDETNWYRFVPVIIRSSSAAQAGTGEIMPDDWQRIHIIKPAGMSYIPQGAYLNFEKNWWIVYKTKNVATVLGDAIVRRCNAVINLLDFYGNIVAVPMSFAKMGTQGNAPHVSENSIIAKNYISCICQLNKVTEKLTENSRLILGKAAYSMRGLNDFTREFTNDPDSVHLLSFTIERTEPLAQDSIEKQCADYHSFKWELVLTAKENMPADGTQMIAVQSIRNGSAVESSDEHPICYIYHSSNTDVAQVDDEGVITGVSEGTAEITVTLAQNREIRQSISIVVADSGGEYVDFTTAPVNSIREFESIDIAAARYMNGTATDDTVSFTFSGPAQSCYSVLPTEPNTYRVTCYTASKVPLKIQISSNGLTEEAEIRLTT